MRKILFLPPIIIAGLLPFPEKGSSGYSEKKTRKEIKIALESSELSELTEYTFPEGIKFVKNNSFTDKPMELPRYPLSKGVISVTQAGTSTYVYEAMSSLASVSGYFHSEMGRKGWKPIPFRNNEGITLFVKGGKLCLLSLMRESGVTTIILVYLPAKGSHAPLLPER